MALRGVDGLRFDFGAWTDRDDRVSVDEYRAVRDLLPGRSGNELVGGDELLQQDLLSAVRIEVTRSRWCDTLSTPGSARMRSDIGP